MQITVVKYTTSFSPLVQAFVDIECDGWLRIIGLNYLRNGTLKPAQMTPWYRKPKQFFDAIQIPDPDLRQLITEEILAAIHAHVETLPPEQRSKPPKLPTPKPVPAAASKPAVAPSKPAVTPKPPAAVVKPANGPKPLLPPRRLSVPKRRIQIHA